MQTKVCTKCGMTKDTEDFGPRKGKYRRPGERHAECKQCTNAYRKQRYNTNPIAAQSARDAANKSYAKAREEMIEAYGGKCACCGETEHRFLSVDHEDDNGAAHRKVIGSGAKRLLCFLKRHDWPKEGFQLLCFNCNCAKGFYGICPHKQLTTV